MQRFRATASSVNVPRPGPSRSSRTPENIELIESSLRENPRLPIRKRAASPGLPRAIIHEILKKHLKFHFKIQIVQELKESDFDLRKHFCETMLEHVRTVNPIFWSNEAHFHRNGHVNKQNCRYRSPRTCNPRLKHQKPLHYPTVTVWCASSTHEIIGPFFSKILEAKRRMSVVKIIDARLRNSFCQTCELIHRTLHTRGFDRMGRPHKRPELR